MKKWMMLMILVPAVALSAVPADLVNYNGVLRDSADVPLDGDFSMVFKFWNADAAGQEILTDTHSSVGTGAVTVTGGLFNVQLGGGSVADGSGPGTYLSLADVFRDYSEVWFEIGIEGETLAPRVRMLSSPYALNSDNLDGLDSSAFANLTTGNLFTSGTQTIETGGDANVGLVIQAENPTQSANLMEWRRADFTIESWIDAGGQFHGNAAGLWNVHADTATTATTATSATSSNNADMVDGMHASQFIYTSSTAQTKSGPLTVNASGTASAYGISGYGQIGGGYFEDSNNSGYALVGYNEWGVRGYGNGGGGYFEDTNSSGKADVGFADKGIWASGNFVGGEFDDLNGSGYAYVAYGNRGIEAYGSDMGGYFSDSDGTGYAWLGYSNMGVRGYGNSGGAYFEDLDNGSWGYVGRGDYGVFASGAYAGGHFSDSDGTSVANIAVADYGVWGEGNAAGGYFKDKNTGIGEAYLGNGNYGVRGFGGPAVTGVLSATTYADLGIEFDPGGGQLLQRYGIKAQGDYAGAYFLDSDGSGEARLAQNNWGINARGNDSGGLFVDLTSSVNMYAAYGMSSTAGSGTKNFVQNHPYDPEKLILYSSLEGDEVGTYTRGSARLVDGEARIRLGETFQWVTNPDIGLTAQITARGPGAMLYVESISTTELVVRSEEGYAGDAAFDYMVHGLRIGFEQFGVVRQKDHESLIPSTAENEAFFEKEPALRSFTALNRFQGMNAALGKTTDDTFAAAIALRDAIGVYDPEIHDLDGSAGGSDVRSAPMPESEQVQEPVSADLAAGHPESGTVVGAEDAMGESETPDLSARNLFPVSTVVEVGDLLVLDMERPGDLMPCLQIGDRTVVGIVSGDVVEREGRMEAPVAFHGVVALKVDAAYGSILPGDLLTSSPTPGHAMAAIAPVQGTVVAKALEPLETGSGMIQVLVMLR